MTRAGYYLEGLEESFIGVWSEEDANIVLVGSGSGRPSLAVRGLVPHTVDFDVVTYKLIRNDDGSGGRLHTLKYSAATNRDVKSNKKTSIFVHTVRRRQCLSDDQSSLRKGVTLIDHS